MCENLTERCERWAELRATAVVEQALHLGLGLRGVDVDDYNDGVDVDGDVGDGVVPGPFAKVLDNLHLLQWDLGVHPTWKIGFHFQRLLEIVQKLVTCLVSTWSWWWGRGGRSWRLISVQISSRCRSQSKMHLMIKCSMDDISDLHIHNMCQRPPQLYCHSLRQKSQQPNEDLSKMNFIDSVFKGRLI